MIHLECTDKRCPIHGETSPRGVQLTGRVVSDKAKKTVIVETESASYMYKINKVTVTDSVLTGDYKVRIDAGLSAAPTFLIPTEALQEFKDLIAKTPIAQRLEMKAFTQA